MNDSFHPQEKYEIGYLLYTPLVYIDVIIPICALVDSGLFVTFMNGRVLYPQSVLPGRRVRVKGFDGTSETFNRWAPVTITASEKTFITHALVIEELNYDFLLSRPLRCSGAIKPQSFIHCHGQI